MATLGFLVVPYQPNDVIEIRAIGILDLQQVMMTFHYVSTAGGANLGAAYDTWLNQFETVVWQQMQPLLSNELQSMTLSVQKIYPQRYRSKVRAAVPSAGGVGTPSLPSGVTVVTKRQGDIADRKNQGRIYIPGIPIASTDESRLTAVALPPFRANVDPAVLQQLDPLGPDEISPVIFNLKAPNVTRRARFALTDQILRYQRRREIGVGV